MNPVALITGASRGIGRAVAVELARLGRDVLINYARNQEAAMTAAAECLEAATAAGQTSVRVEVYGGDIGEREVREGLIAFCRSAFGRLDLLVNNAGVAPLVRSDLLETTEESYERLMRVNVKGPFFLTQLAARWMIEQSQALRAGGSPSAPYRPKIITVSSISAYTASASRGEYCVSKAALSMVSSLFAARLAQEGIQVFEIRPGVIATDMTEAVRGKYDQLIEEGLTPIRRWGRPEDIAKAVSAIAQDLLPFSTGEILNVDGGFHLRTL